MGSKTRGNSNIPNRLSVADRTALLAVTGTREGEVVLQNDIGLLYTWTETQGVDNGGTIINVGTGSWIAKYDGAVHAKWFGVIGDGTNKDIEMQNALDAITQNVLYTSEVLVLSAGEYSFSSNFIIPPYISIKSAGIVRLNFTGTGAMFKIKYDTITDPMGDPDGLSQNPNNNSNLFDGSDGALIFSGSGLAGTQTCLEFGDNLATASTSRHTAWLNVSNIFIDGFQTAYIFNANNVFIMRFYNCNASGCAVIIGTVDEANTNAGEQIDWFGCAFHNSNKIMNLDSQFNMEFHGCSFDYGIGIVSAITITKDYQTVRFIGGWIEAPSQDAQAFIESTVADASRLHIDMLDMYIQPRDKKQTTLLKGKMSVALNNNTFVVNRFENYPLSAVGQHQHFCNSDVKIVEASGNRFFDQMVNLGIDNALNLNSSFETDVPGTTANAGAPSTITGWIHNGGIGSADLVIDNTVFSSGLQSVKVDQTTGTYVSISSHKFSLKGKRLYANLALLSPLDTSINVDYKIYYYDNAGALISTTTTPTTQSVLPLTWVSGKHGIYDTPPKNAFSAEVGFSIGGFSSDIWLDDVIIEHI